MSFMSCETHLKGYLWRQTCCSPVFYIENYYVSRSQNLLKCHKNFLYKKLSALLDYGFSSIFTGIFKNLLIFELN